MLNSQGLMVVYPCFCPKGGKFSREAALPNAPSTAHGARSAAATCDGAATESLLRRRYADQLRRAHSARRVRDAADAAATELMTRNPNKWVANQEKNRDFFFPKSKSGHYKMSTLHFSSDIGLGPGPLADP
jgi:hypothetical protein